MNLDLFGEPIIDNPQTKRRDRIHPGKSNPAKHGHAAAPGTGPAGETCGTCRHLVKIRLTSKCVHKCALARKYWTGGLATDIRCRDAACGFWRPLEAAKPAALSAECWMPELKRVPPSEERPAGGEVVSQPEPPQDAAAPAVHETPLPCEEKPSF